MEIDFDNIEVSKESKQLANKAYPDDKYLASNAAYWIEIGRKLERYESNQTESAKVGALQTQARPILSE